jgi:hypothetical protein
MRPVHPDTVERLSAALIVLIGTVLLFVVAPITQPQSYHRFADIRGIHLAGWLIPNAANVLSNAGFLIFGLWGLSCIRRVNLAQRFPLSVFFTGLVLTSLGSGFYHWQPSDASLLWDRLPMAVAFAGAIGALSTERLGARQGLRWFNMWLCLSLLSLGLWAMAGDLRLYVLAQFGGLLIMVLWLLLPAAPIHARLPWMWLLVGYLAAKCFELGDWVVWSISSHTFAGHALKHIAAACAIVPMILKLKRLPVQKM